MVAKCTLTPSPSPPPAPRHPQPSPSPPRPHPHPHPHPHPLTPTLTLTLTLTDSGLFSVSDDRSQVLLRQVAPSKLQLKPHSLSVVQVRTYLRTYLLT